VRRALLGGPGLPPGRALPGRRRAPGADRVRRPGRGGPARLPGRPRRAVGRERQPRRPVAVVGPRMKGPVRAWDWARGRKPVELGRHGTYVYAVAVEPGGRFAATAGGDRTVCFWDLAAGRPAGGVRGALSDVTALAFLPDGRTLVTGDADGV